MEQKKMGRPRVESKEQKEVRSVSLPRDFWAMVDDIAFSEPGGRSGFVKKALEAYIATR